MDMKDDHRKAAIASSHYRLRTLRQHLISWQLWVSQHKIEREREREQQSVRSKMSTFLADGQKMFREQPTQNQSIEKEPIPDQKAVVSYKNRGTLPPTPPISSNILYLKLCWPDLLYLNHLLYRKLAK